MKTSLALRNLGIVHSPDSHHVIYEGAAVGSIGTSMRAGNETFWRWNIFDNSPRSPNSGFDGEGQNLEHCMVLFRAAWDKKARNPDWLEGLMTQHRQMADRPWNKA